LAISGSINSTTIEDICLRVDSLVSYCEEQEVLEDHMKSHVLGSPDFSRAIAGWALNRLPPRDPSSLSREQSRNRFFTTTAAASPVIPHSIDLS
jgi:hypothetical protein